MRFNRARMPRGRSEELFPSFDSQRSGRAFQLAAYRRLRQEHQRNGTAVSVTDYPNQIRLDITATPTAWASTEPGATYAHMDGMAARAVIILPAGSWALSRLRGVNGICGARRLREHNNYCFGIQLITGVGQVSAGVAECRRSDRRDERTASGGVADASRARV